MPCVLTPTDDDDPGLIEATSRMDGMSRLVRNLSRYCQELERARALAIA
jgi:hypothetical protein